MTATYEIKDPVEGEVGDKVVLKKESVTEEKVEELTLNNLQSQLDAAKQQEVDAKARQVEIEAVIAKVRAVVGTE